MRFARFLLGASLFLMGPLADSALAQQEGDHLIISDFTVPHRNSLSAGEPYLAWVHIRTTGGAAVAIRDMCFYWNQEGPFCLDQWHMEDTGDGGVRPTIALKTGNPGQYDLTVYLTYRYQRHTYRTNAQQVQIRVH